jgi:hypothetical protein
MCFLSLGVATQSRNNLPCAFTAEHSHKRLSSHNHLSRPSPAINSNMCLFSSSPPRGRRHGYVEEVVVAARPVSRHSHRSQHHHGHTHGRTSYTSVTRTTSQRPTSATYYTSSPRVSQTSYRRSGPVVVEQRRSTGYYR